MPAPDLASVTASALATLDGCYAMAGQPTVAAQLAQLTTLNGTLTTQVGTLTGERDTALTLVATLQGAINAARAAAQAEKDADATSVAGQSVLDALPPGP